MQRFSMRCSRPFPFFTGLVLLRLLTISAPAATNYMYGGIYNNWPSTWNVLLSLNDPNDGKTGRFDFVGDNSDPCAYWSMDGSYVYFRMRVNDGAPGSNLWAGSFFVLIDQADKGPSKSLDYAFSWDYKENLQQNHGLELQVTNIVGNSWGGVRNFDIDGANASKIAPPDFSLSGGQGYVRTIEGQNTVNFGLTTYIDMAVSWNYLSSSATTCTLTQAQTWRIQLGSTENANDHNWIDTDVAGNKNPADITLSFPGTIVTIPEPSTLLLIATGIGALSMCRFLKR